LATTAALVIFSLALGGVGFGVELISKASLPLYGLGPRAQLETLAVSPKFGVNFNFRVNFGRAIKPLRGADRLASRLPKYR
jgi:hypothetical protein